ncbi:dTMP kinase [Candidatus Cryosericum terrychapinii]|jgi:dTMP kinase|uniref:Thymidylate kinase n=1 Tax=Candidatus Cryosericum terrychapinii TaxID=2290919 RepID=A0A398CSI0_9BACT|nr:dTMP kinase [Candidatus Cryosericum terrychapinii]RIE06366.1 dTMP kinase [Candidatus Cryosericum terrychapinii]
MRRAFFLTFEGIDGCGKSTQAKRLEQALTERLFPVTHTFEPGGTLLGRKLRTILVHDELNLSLFSEVLLFAADRRQDIDEIINPALERGDIVIGERFADSSVAYQGIAGKVGKERVERLMDIVTSGLVPDLTLLLDIDPRVSLDRKIDLDRIEQRGLFLDVVRHAFLDMATSQPERWVTIDAARPMDDVFSDVLKAVLKRLE